MTLITLKTNFPSAIDSPDHIAPCGTTNDNNTNRDYINQVRNYFKKSPLRVLDLGCAGGQLISDFISLGDIGVGLEGSPLAYQIGKGKENWDKYKDANLFTVDLTKSYQLYEDGEPMKFDFITSWDVLEHISENDLPNFLQYVKNHLSDDGVFCCGIAATKDEEMVDGKLIVRHQSVFNCAKWLNIMYENGFVLPVEPHWTAEPVGHPFVNNTTHENYGIDPQGVVCKLEGMFFGYLFGNTMFRNHYADACQIIFCLKNKIK